MEENKILGINIVRKLSFVPHLKYVFKKDLKALKHLNVLDSSEWGTDRKVMLPLYWFLIRSKLDYRCILYGSARKSYFQMLDPIHNQGLKFCLGPFRTSSVDSLYVDAHESSLDARRAKMSLQYAIKIKSLLIHPAHNAMFDNKYTMLFDVPYVLLAFVSSNFHVLPTLISRSIWCIKPPKIVRKFGATEKDRKDTSIYIKNVSWKYVTFLFI